MNDPKLNEHYILAVAACASPEDEHDLKARSSEYALGHLDKAAVKGPGRLRTKLLNEHTVEGKMQQLEQLRGYKSLLELRPNPTIEDLKRLVEICYNLSDVNFPEYRKHENEPTSDEFTKEIASIIIGRLCEFLGFRVPRNLSSDTSQLCNELRLLYTVVDERPRRLVRPPMMVDPVPPPPPPHARLTQDTDSSASVLSYEKLQRPSALKRVWCNIRRSLLCGTRVDYDDSDE